MKINVLTSANKLILQNELAPAFQD